MKEQIKNLLGQGLPPSVVATAVGCQPSYVSQLMADEAFALDVSKLRVASLQAATERDGKWDTLEDKLLKKLEDLIPFMTRPMEVLRALQVTNGAKRRGLSSQEGLPPSTTIVNLNLPKTLQLRFSTNEKREIIEVDGRAMATMPANAVVQMLSSLTPKLPEGTTYEHAQS